MRTEVCATVRLPAFHRWPDAPEDVGYLRSRHRHLLTVRVWMAVRHANREVEFHQLQRQISALLLDLLPACNPGELEMGAFSCEHVANLLYENADRLCGTPSVVEVWEDDENGVRVWP